MKSVCTTTAVALVLSFVWLSRSAAAQGAEPVAPALSKPPRLVHFVAAIAPPALESVKEADVTLVIDVDESGHVKAVEVASGAGDGFDEAAVAAALKFVFEPGEYQGKPVPVRVTYRYHFALPPPPRAPAAPVAPAAPETVPIDGLVLQRGDRAPLAGVAVIVDDTSEQTTNDKGAFHFAAATIGAHSLKLRGATFAPFDATIKVNAGKRLQLTYYVIAKERYSSTVRGKHVVVEVVKQTLRTEEIKRIPGTQGDVLKAVQNLPGVAHTAFGTGNLIVWGSSPQDTRAYVDGVYIPTLYHFGGQRSTLNGEMVQSLSFAPGGFSVEHGFGLGGVVDIETRAPRTDGYHGFVQLDLIDGSFKLEGPITKTLSFSAGLRRSWIDAFLPLFTTGNFQLSPAYWDYQAKLDYHPNSRDHLQLFFFGSDDQLTLKTNTFDPALSASFNQHTYYHHGLVSWLHRFAGQTTLSVTASAGYDQPSQANRVQGNAVSSDSAHSFDYTLKAVVRAPLRRWLRLDAGVDFEGSYFTFDRTGAVPSQLMPGGGPINAVGPGAGTSGYATDNMNLYANHVQPFAAATFSFFDKRLTIIPQLRLAVFTYSGYQGTPNAFTSAFIDPEPRLTVRYQPIARLAIKASAGLYHQSPRPQDLSAAFGNRKLAPESAVHLVAGFEFQATPTLQLELTGFYKDMRNLVVPGEKLGDPILTNDGIGRVYGGSLLIRQELWKNFFGWASYTLSRAERQDHPDQASHLFQFDQTHILTIVASYKLPRGYQVGIRFRYVTGSPYTAAQSAVFDSNQNSYTPIAGPAYGARLGSFNQLDLRVDKTWTFDRWSLSAYLDLQNAYDAANPAGVTYNFNYTKKSTVNDLPILPVLGLRGDF
ncbi:MAG: TonB family protein / TonB-dependent receptor [bacterium]|nr:TonB family protein / TonB-dependent receptor [bacterium]